MQKSEQFGRLPGGALVRQGLDDLGRGRATVPALLLEIARGRLVRAGLLLPRETLPPLAPELQLYRQLRAEGGDAYARYNSLLRELSSFLQAFERLSPERRSPSHAEA